MRNYNLDFIRGIAVLGLVFMNIYTFGVFELGYTPLTTPPSSDSLIQTLNLIFIEGRFRSIFSILFGAALYIQWQRYNLVLPLKSRLYWLLVFGLLHGFLLWAGDILFLYGVSGLLAIRYLSSTNEQLLKHAYGFILLSGLATALVMYSVPETLIYRDSPEFNALYSQYFQSYGDHLLSNITMNALMVFMVPILTMWVTTALMLLGIYLYKQQVFASGLSAKQLILVISSALLFTSLRLTTEQYSSGVFYALQELINSVAALCMAVIYIHIAVKLCSNNANTGKLIQQVGRLAFSLYISQTLMQLVLFKVFFKQWSLSFNRIDYCLVATLLIVIQLIITAIYSRYFQQGPLEYIWRKLTYAKITA